MNLCYINFLKVIQHMNNFSVCTVRSSESQSLSFYPRVWHSFICVLTVLQSSIIWPFCQCWSFSLYMRIHIFLHLALPISRMSYWTWTRICRTQRTPTLCSSQMLSIGISPRTGWILPTRWIKLTHWWLSSLLAYIWLISLPRVRDQYP